MVFDVLALAILAGGAYAMWQEHLRSRPRLPPDDLPPAAARQPLPRHGRLRGYVDDGLHSIDEYLAGPDPERGDRPA